MTHGWSSALAPLAAGPFDTVTHQQIDHVGGHTQIVVKAGQDLQVGGAELLAQLLLRLWHQQAEALVVRQQSGDVLGGVDRAFVRRIGRCLAGRSRQQVQVLKDLLRRVDPQAADGQDLFQLLRCDAPAEAAQGQIQQGGVALPALQQLVGRIGGQRQLLLSVPKYIAVHGDDLPSHSCSPFYTKKGSA